MATVSILDPPHTQASMSTRRIPLGSNPNAANSPFRGVVTAASMKPKRSHATIQREEAYGQPPPAKKQIIEVRESRSPSRATAGNAIENHVFSRRAHAQPTAFDKKLEAARRRPTQQAMARPDRAVERAADKAAEENLQTIRAWQRHYRKVFPTYTFYFESVPEEARQRYTKQVTQLGAKEEKFFCSKVTHVVTSRAIPVENAASPTESAAETDNGENQSNTINPSLLERTNDHAEPQPLKGRAALDAAFARASGAGPREARNTVHNEVRKPSAPPQHTDILLRAREMGIKIWAMEKLERMMTTMFDTNTDYASHAHNTRATSASLASRSRRDGRDTDLSLLLKQEKNYGPTDRDLSVPTKDMILFKGPFIYIHDIDERQKPIMVREYTKVPIKEQGDWPQFRSVAQGKCPFVPEADNGRRDAEREARQLARQQRQLEKEKEEREARAASQPRTRAATAAVEARMQPPPVTERRVLGETESAGNRGAAAVSTEDEEASSQAQPNAYVNRAVAPRLFLGEPVASGIQQSNITSAIRSQMISSTAAAPGAKAGTSKELHGLQRKVLEKNSGPVSMGLTSSHRMTDLSIHQKENIHGQKRKTSTLREEESFDIENQESLRRNDPRPVKPMPRRRAPKRDPKPGYCENCMDKFDDFDEHILSRKHRRFAEKADNWKELDQLLKQLDRPVKDEYRNQYM